MVLDLSKALDFLNLSISTIRNHRGVIVMVLDLSKAFDFLNISISALRNHSGVIVMVLEFSKAFDFLKKKHGFSCQTVYPNI